MRRLRAYVDRLRYVRDPVVVLVIPLLVGCESLLFLYWRDVWLSWWGVSPPLLFALDRWWFDIDSGLPMQTFLLIFHPVLVVLLWVRWRFNSRRDRVTTISYVACDALLAACQWWVVAFSNATPKIVLEQIYP